MITNPECGICDDRGCSECLPPVLKHHIGAVGFGQVCEPATNSAGFRVLNHIGDERKALLRRARDGVALPAGMLLIAQIDGGAWRRIRKDDVNWEGCRL